MKKTIEIIREATSPSGARVKLERTCGTYNGARPYFVVSSSHTPRVRYPNHEDRAVATFEAYAQDVTEPAKVGERLRALETRKTNDQGGGSGSAVQRIVSTRETVILKRGFDDGAAVSRRPEGQGHHGHKGGRPRKHPSKAAKDRAASRAYRRRRNELVTCQTFTSLQRGT